MNKENLINIHKDKTAEVNKKYNRKHKKMIIKRQFERTYQSLQ